MDGDRAQRKTRLLLADDHAVMRTGLRMLLNAQPDMEVVGEAMDGDEALVLARQHRPDIILMDISMPCCDGLKAARRVRQEMPDTKVLILTMHEDKGYLYQALRAGAAGYVVKSAADIELITAIRAVKEGGVFLHPMVARDLVQEMLSAADWKHEFGKVEERPHGLSPRELEVLRLIALGHTNQEIAEILVLSVKTVETHKTHIMEKLGPRTRSELVRYAIKNGLLGTLREQ